MFALAKLRERMSRGGTLSRARETALRKPFCRAAALVALAALLPAITGCLYPQEKRKENQAAASESILVVQHAVDLFKERNGILPIKNSESDTPIYEKYVIDLRRLTQGPYLGQVPGIAFEQGGSSLFVLVDPERKPLVKLLDLTVHQKAGDVQRAVDDYRRANNGAIPSGESVGPDVYRLDFAKLGKKNVQVESVYSRSYTTYLVSAGGTVGIDYAPDIMKAMERGGMKSAEDGFDLRELLVAASPYVPVKSFPYYWTDNEPKPSAS